jgi:O-antigen/teichoic acid export membrane protein
MSTQPGLAPIGSSSLTEGRLLARNALLSIAGEAAPLALGLIAIPILVRELGVDRYGVLTLSYLIVGYLGLFHLGLGSAAAQQISDAIGAGETDKIPSIFWTSMSMMFILGICAAALLMGTSHWLAYSVLKIPAPLRSESAGVFLVMGAALPFILSGACTVGALASFQRFDITSAVGAATGVYWYTAPLIVLIFTHSLVWIVGVLVAGRLAAWAANLILCLRLVPGLTAKVRPSRHAVRPLLSFGGWITVSGLTSPLMDYFDRFVIGSILSIAAVSYYSVPYQIVSKVLIVQGAMAGVLFPAFSATARKAPSRAATLFDRASRYALLALFPGVLILFFFSREILTLFFGVVFASHGSIVMRWLLIGIFMNGLAHIPYTLVQAANRPDLTAKFHMAELPIYFVALFLLLPRFGIAGAAAAWTLRVTFDAVALFTASAIILPATKAGIGRTGCFGTIASAVIGCGAILPGLEYRIVGAAAALFIYAFIGWYHVLDSPERSMLIQKLTGRDSKPELLAKPLNKYANSVSEDSPGPQVGAENANTRQIS